MDRKRQRQIDKELSRSRNRRTGRRNIGSKGSNNDEIKRRNNLLRTIRLANTIANFSIVGVMHLTKEVLSPKKEKSIVFRILTPFVFLCVCTIFMVNIANYGTEQQRNNYTENISSIVMTDEIYNKLFVNADGNDMTGISPNYPINGQDIITIENTGNVSEGIQDVTLSNIELQMINQYSSIIENVSKQVGVPSWVMYALNFWEGRGGLYDLSVRIGKGMFDAEQFGTKHSKTKVVVDYYTYGIEETKADGRLDSTQFIGPFQLSRDIVPKDGNGDGVGDHYNFADAALTAAYHVKGKYDAIAPYMPSGTSPEVMWITACGAYNAGEGGFKRRYPKDSISTYVTEILRFTEKETMKEIADGYYNTGRGGKGLTAVIKHLDKQGWKTEKSTRDKKWAQGINWQSPTIDLSTLPPYWPANNSGTRGNYVNLPTEEHASDFFTFEKDGNPTFMMNNRQNIEYLSASYAIGTRIRDNIATVLGKAIEDSVNNNPNNGITKNGAQRVIYNWEQEQLDNGVLFEDLKLDPQGHTKEGKYHEVGYKGNFPIFIQATGSNYVSNLPWKFGGKKTTLGTSGCSIFALTSLIHGAGYGTLEIPNAPGKLPTFENIISILDNGPIISNDVKNKLGYQVNVMPTETEDDLNALWEQLEKGVPYIVNVCSKPVTAYDEYLRPTTTKFTSGGHFIILAGGYEMNGKRFVEVVQSTDSKAGQKKPDQNRAIFDFDEMIKNKVIRSSSGAAVPAYTITGAKGYPEPKYLQRNYIPPTRTEQIGTGVNVENTEEDIVIDSVVIQ